MAEDEIIKHTKTIYKAWKDPHKGWFHKFKEILVEILIIIFAVSVSIWFHNWSESLKDRKEEKEFLTGLKGDLQGDIIQMQGDMESYKNTITGINYFMRVANGAPLQNDSLAKYGGTFFNTTQLVPNTSRFEALKSSGKLSIIENTQLLNNILELYQEHIVQVIFLNHAYIDYKLNHLGSFIDDNVHFDAKGNIDNWNKILIMPKMHMFLARGGAANANILEYQAAIDKCKQIITEIDKELK